MKRILIYLSLLTLVFAVPALAENNTVIKVHVDKAVAVPGHVLQPGDYTFRLNDASRTVVEISSADSKTTYGFVQVFATQRDVSGDNEIRATAPDASGLARIDSWYFPGERSGFRFIYSKEDLRKVDMLAEQLKAKATRSGM